MLDSVLSKLKSSEKNMSRIDGASDANQKVIDQLKDAIVDIKKHEQEQRDWLSVYFTKNKAKRKSMFYEKKTSLFGIPVN